MSSDQQVKKRRLDRTETPKAVSAISAIAARRLGTTGTSSPPSPLRSDDISKTSHVNYFSPLQKTGAPNESSNPPQKATLKQARSLRSSQASAGHSTTSKQPRGEIEEPITASPSAVSAVVQFSSFRLTKQNHRTKAGGVIELRLGDGERFLVLGSYGIRVLHGEVTVCGASLRPSESPQWVHAPHCHALPVMRTVEKSGLELYPNPRARGLRQLGKISPLFRRLWNEGPESSDGKQGGKSTTFQVICTSEDAPKRCIMQDLVSPAAWNRRLATLVECVRKKSSWATLVCGPKSAGKSTFSKLLTNRLLTDRALNLKGIAVLDLDPGQPEYAPAGTLSLIHVTRPNLGTPFTHPGFDNSYYQITRCHALASVTPASDPALYTCCANDLFETYHKTLPDLPLVINTPGWILGTGLDLLSDVIKKVEPDEILYMSEEGPLETVETLQAVSKTTLVKLPSQPSEFTSRTAAHLRAMQAMSYFHMNCPLQAAARAKKPDLEMSWNPSPLTAARPWVVPYSRLSPGFLGILSYDYQSPPELLAETINGLVLAAVEIEDTRAFRGLVTADARKTDQKGPMGVEPLDNRGLRPTVSTTSDGLPYIANHADETLDPRYSRLLGLVLIRGIDTKAKALHILTPLPFETIAGVKSQGRDIILVHGKFDPPHWVYTEDLYQRAGGADGVEVEVEIAEGDTSEDDSDAEPEAAGEASDAVTVPWVEILKGNQRRPVGSKVWRVRRDLGRNLGD